MTETIIKDEVFMQEAIRLSKLAVLHGNEPFGAVLVKDGGIVYTNENQIMTQQDPTFHAEIGLIRRFCMETGQKDLRGYTLYSSCEPCFMCSGAMWGGLFMRPQILILKRSYIKKAVTAVRSYLSIRIGNRR